MTTPAGLPQAFLDFLAHLWAQNQRDKFSSVYSKLVIRYRAWRAGEKSAAIPGYAECPEPGRNSTDLPSGWTYSNLKKAVTRKFARRTLNLATASPTQLVQIAKPEPSNN